MTESFEPPTARLDAPVRMSLAGLSLRALPLETRILVGLGVPWPVLRDAAERAAATESCAAGLLIGEGVVDEQDWWEAVARHLALPLALDLPAEAAGETGSVPPASYFRNARVVRSIGHGPATWLAVAPCGGEIDLLADLLARDPTSRARLAIAPPAIIRSALRQRHLPRIGLDAVVGIVRRDPALSALGAPTRAQCAALALILASACWSVLAFGEIALALLALTAAVLFCGCSAVRVAAAWSGSVPPRPPPLSVDDPDLPSYAVLVPLYREAAVVEGLLAALERLLYPRDRLDIVLVVEADDIETREAVAAANATRRFDVVAVPPGLPRTKPKALDVALAFVDAELIALFDAEDRPDPDQLLVAASAFRHGPPDLAAVQAELAIDHDGDSSTWLSRLFALEYAMLFRGLLPWLAAKGVVLPLGGTSNHFRRSALIEVGGWDPHNVTEDADLALRLARYGYRMGVIPSRTHEEAPLHLRAWLGQRSRWLKGWMQTWFVHMRAPRQSLAEMGWPSFLAFQAVTGGQLVGAFAYPLGLVTLAALLLGTGLAVDDRSLAAEVVRAACLVAFASGFAATAALGLRVLLFHPDRRLLAGLLLFPIYALLIFLAAVRAALELVRAPYHWEKTSHGIARRNPVGQTQERGAGAAAAG